MIDHTLAGFVILFTASVLAIYALLSFTSKYIDARIAFAFLIGLYFIIGTNQFSLGQSLFGVIKFASLALPLFLYYNKKITYTFGSLLTRLIYVFLLLNIFEAVIYGVLTRNYLNALTGLLLIACTPRRGVLLSTPAPAFGLYIPFALNTDRAWILAYVLWNTAFVINYFDGINPYNIGFTLLLPLILCINNPNNFIAIRALFLFTNAVLTYGLFYVVGVDFTRSAIMLVGRIPAPDLIQPALNAAAILFMLYASYRSHRLRKREELRERDESDRQGLAAE